MSLSPQSIEIIKSTAPVIAEHGYTITRTMYRKMLDPDHGAGEEVVSLFNPKHQIEINGSKAEQPSALAASVLAYAQNVDNLDALSDAVELIAHKHVSLGVQAEHYDVVGEHLLWAIKEVLGDAATPIIMDAWKEGYTLLANIFISRERAIMEEKAAERGGWMGLRAFKCVKKFNETSDICTFYFEAQDGQPIVSYKAGQYITICMSTKDTLTYRNYSLSMGPGNDKYYRISVKREVSPQKGIKPGVVSNWLHEEVKVGDTVKLGVPCGDFKLESAHSKPVVLIAAGVGFTPILSMVEDLLAQKSVNNITVVIVAKNAAMDGISSALDEMTKNNKLITVKKIYTAANSEESLAENVYSGRFSMNILEDLIAEKDAHYYFCGPRSFVKMLFQGLRSWGIVENQLHFEYFGPSSDIKGEEASLQSNNIVLRELTCPLGYGVKIDKVGKEFHSLFNSPAIALCVGVAAGLAISAAFKRIH